MAKSEPGSDRTARRYAEKRDFARTPEPAFAADAHATGRGDAAPLFVVQKHAASRLHWDFRLEHDGALWSWAVPKGPSMDTAHKRLAMHVEDHPVDYAGFEGTIPAGNYGAGQVEIWDRGTWSPLSDDPATALAAGELKFSLDGSRLEGGFVLVRLKPRGREKAESWLLIKERDGRERHDADASALEGIPLRAPDDATGRTGGKRDATRRKAGERTHDGQQPAGREDDRTEGPGKRATSAGKAESGGTAGGKRSARVKRGSGAVLPDTQAPQLARLVSTAPAGAGWISEIKFDGYRMLCRRDGAAVRLITRNGLDWTDRVPELARAVAALPADTLMLDGELVALDRQGRSSFPLLQAALSSRRTDRLRFYAFDLLHRDGTDLRPSPLRERREALGALLAGADGMLRFSEHFDHAASRVQKKACAVGLEGIVCKKADAPYRPGRGEDWVKVKCENREEFVVLGHTPPAGSRRGLGALQLGFHAPDGTLQFVGGCGTGFSGRVLTDLAAKLRALAGEAPASLFGSEPPPRDTIWARPELVAEVRHAGFSGGGMLRHASFQGLREDKPASEVVRALPDADAARRQLGDARAPSRIVTARAAGRGAGTSGGSPRSDAGHDERGGADTSAGAAGRDERQTRAASSIVVARPSRRDAVEINGQRLSHPDRVLWPADETGPALTKRDLAAYWQAVSAHAAGEILGRPLAFVRCPDGIGGEHFFQKHLGRGMPDPLREGSADGAPFVAFDTAAGFTAAAQVAAIELHGWGAAGGDPSRADRLVFDLDPGEGIGAPEIVAAARDVRARLETLGLTAFCRTSGGKGLHVLAPLRTGADWDTVRAWCRSFAERMEADQPDRYVSTTRKTDRRGRILVDWLRNGLGSTAACSFSPRARPGAGVATPLFWRELRAGMRFDAHTIRTVPDRLRRQKTDPWAGFAEAARDLPELDTMRPRKRPNG